MEYISVVLECKNYILTPVELVCIRVAQCPDSTYLFHIGPMECYKFLQWITPLNQHFSECEKYSLFLFKCYIFHLFVQGQISSDFSHYGVPCCSNGQYKGRHCWKRLTAERYSIDSQARNKRLLSLSKSTLCLSSFLIHTDQAKFGIRVK